MTPTQKRLRSAMVSWTTLCALLGLASVALGVLSAGRVSGGGAFVASLAFIGCTLLWGLVMLPLGGAFLYQRWRHPEQEIHTQPRRPRSMSEEDAREETPDDARDEPAPPAAA